MHLKGSNRTFKLRDVAGDRRTPLLHQQKLRASQVASNGLRRAYGKGHILWGHLFLPQWSRSRGSGGHDGLSLGWDPMGREPIGPLQWGRKHWGKEELTCLPHGPQLPPSPLAKLQEYLPCPAPAPGFPLTLGRLHITSSWLPPQLPQAMKWKNKLSLVRWR